MVAWYSSSWHGSLGHVQRKLLPELDRVVGIVFDDAMTPAQVPNCPQWLEEMFARSAVTPRPDACIVFGPHEDAPADVQERYERLAVYCTTHPDPAWPPLSSKVRLFITPSRWAQSMLDDSRRAVSAVVPHGVDLDLFRPAEVKRADDALKVLCVTTASRPSKRLDLVIDCFKQAFPNGEPATLTIKVPSILVWYGRHLLPATAVQRHIADARITFLAGAMSEQELAELYRAHDMFLYASEWESFGLTVAEARACGLPLVVTPVTALAEQVEGGPESFSAERLRALTDPVVRAKAVPRTRPLTWAESAQTLVEALQAMLAESSTG